MTSDPIADMRAAAAKIAADGELRGGNSPTDIVRGLPFAPITELTDPDTGEQYRITKAVDLDSEGRKP